MKTFFSGKKIMTCVFLLNVFALAIVTSVANAHENADPLLTSVMLEQLEWRTTDEENIAALEGEVSIGKDLNKLWLKVDAEYAHNEFEKAEVQVLYSRAITPFWDVQTGLRHDREPAPSKNWGVIGVKGLAPYFIEIDSALFIGESGASALRVITEHELMLTQRWRITPELEVNVYGHNDRQRNIGAGLAYVEAGLRLGYEIRRELAPYIGVHWHKKFGNTADFAVGAGEEISEREFVAGVRIEF